VRLGYGIDHPLPYSKKVKERNLYSPMGLHGLFYGILYLYIVLKLMDPDSQ
jgi:hypothetical protein